jgi:LmbE family N-acetylglucosaminyl deacetylase
MKKILVIAVHPDDETLGCGGTILKHKDMGNEVHWLILTKANQKITSITDIEKKQREDVIKVADQYGFDSWQHLDFLTTELDRYALGELVSAISTVIHNIAPHYIYLNHFADVHSDHRIAFDAVYSCTKNFRYPFIEKILLYETLSETEFAPPSASHAFIPNMFNDVTKYMDKKLQIMKLYTTEQMDEPFPRAMSSISSLARYRGSRIGVEFAEAFMLQFEKCE